MGLERKQTGRAVHAGMKAGAAGQKARATGRRRMSPCRRIALSVAAFGCTAAFAQAIRFTRHEIRDLGKERIVGAALDGKRLVTWGDRILIWDLQGGSMQPAGARTPRSLGPGGVLLDIDGDGQPDLVLNQATGRRALFWINL